MNLPPGSPGLPLLGETLDFSRNGFSFVDDRLKKHGRIFRTRILGRDTIVISGPDSCVPFLDGDKLQRSASMPPHVQALFAGRSLPLLDGDLHRERKRGVLRALDAAALATYLPTMERKVAAALARWSDSPQLRLVDACKRLALETICENILSLDAGPVTERLKKDYDTISKGLLAIPVAFPGGALWRAFRARDRILRVLRDEVRRHEKSPIDDGLSRMLTGEGAMDAEAAVLELHHLVVAGYIIFSPFTFAIMALDRHPDVRGKLEVEIRREAPPGALTPALLARMPYLFQVVRECKRMAPVLPVIFSKAKIEFEFGGYTIPKDWMVLWAVWASNQDTQFAAPEKFDPDRFSPERAEDKKHPHALTPQGPGAEMSHRCPGVDYSTVFIQTFLIHLLRSYTWELPPQNLELDWSITPPEPGDGLAAKIRRRK